MTWKPTALLEGQEEVWVTFYNEELDKEVTIEVCSVEDLIYNLIGDQDEVNIRIRREIEEQEN
tara:strand:+ start:597 stop:785 length:189 start_codon:yes stop_codon:yes gene_type:complete